MAGAEIEENKGKSALDEISPKLREIEPQAFATMRGTDVNLAATKLVQTGLWLKTPTIEAAFKPLDAIGFDSSIIRFVEPAARAVLYLRAQIDLATSSASGFKLPEELFKEATALRARLFKLLEYYFDDHPVIRPQLDEIREGSGYLDLAQDLTKLGTLAEANDETLKVDTRHYRETDRADAHRVASRIYEELDAQSEKAVKALRDQLARAWTLLIVSWDETCLAGRLLFRKDAEKLARFSSAYAFGRRASSKSSQGSNDIETPTDGSAESPS